MLKRSSIFFVTILALCAMWTISVSGAELFPVSQNGKWGYIDSTGKLIVEYKYDYAEGFEFGVATVRDKDGSYILGSTGQIILTPEPEAFVQIDGTGIYHRYNDVMDYYDLKGNLIGGNILPEPGTNLEGRFTKDYAAFWFNEPGSPDAFYGFVDKTGNVIIPAKYAGVATPESSENFVVRDTDGIWKLIDVNEEIIAEYPAGSIVSGAFNIGDLFAMFNINEEQRFGYYSLKTGELVLPHKYTRAGYFRDDRAIVAEPSGLGVINIKGEYVIPPKYNHVYPIGEGLFGANTYDGIRLILDADGKVLLERKDGVLHFPNFKFGYNLYFDDGKMHIFGTDGKVKYSIPSLASGRIMSDRILENDGKYINFITGETIYNQNEITHGDIRINWITEGKDYEAGGWNPTLYQYPVVSGYKDTGVNNKVNSVLKNVFVDEGILNFSNYHTGATNSYIFGKVGYLRNKPLIGIYDTEMKLHSISAVVNMQTGKIYTLSDLLLPGYEEKLKEQIGKSLGGWEGFESANENTEFGLYDEGIVIPLHIPGARVTDPGSYNDILIPYTDIDDILNKNGEMWYAIKYSDIENLKTQQLTFTDMPIEHWATMFVQDANYHEIIFGDTKNGKPVFRPNDNLKYTEAIAMAVRAMDLPAADRKLSSIDQTQWYAEEINKAYSAGLLEGINFRENSNISRKEMFMVLAHGIKNIEPDKNVILQRFSDCDDLSEAALEAASICYKAGIIIGNEDKLNPDGLLTRAEIAKIIIYFVKAVN